MEILLLTVPFLTSALMFGVKKLAGLAMIGNGTKPRVFLRATLVLLSLGGVMASAGLTGNEIDPNAVSDLIVTFFETGIVAYLSHAFYNSRFRR